ncbi:MAG: flippase activity-associated protein Agl23 [Planctomycetota bacterium]|jgi:uncharacterized protein (TIGR03663 family)
MNKKAATILLFTLVFSGGAFFRLWRLNDRPMHTDEAVHAEKFAALLVDDHYQYDPHEFHGPTLNYFTLFSAWLRGETSYEQISETTLRLTTAVFGVLLILTPLLFIRMLGIRPVLFCAILIAFSPGFIYYSRYYIQETLLLFFTAYFLGCLCNYLRSPKLRWLVLSSVAAGLMHATKETFIFSIIAAAAAIVIGVSSRDIRTKVKFSHLVCGVMAMLLASAVFYSSFGGNPNGILDSVKTYLIWAVRAGGASVHVHPWYFYLDLLTWIEFIEPISWNEDGIVGFAVIGLVFTYLKKGGRRYRCARFLVIYTLVLTVIYSIIPYKTPWSMMSFVYGMAVVAGFAADRMLRAAQGSMTRFIFGVFILVYGLASPVAQSWLLNFHYASDPVNPYVYAHTSRDVYQMADAVDKAARVAEDGASTRIQVIANDDDYWPLPWYLRKYPNVGYWNTVDDSLCHAPIILSNAKHERSLLAILYSVPEAGKRHLYVPLFDEPLSLRPGVQWQGYIRSDLWEQVHHSEDLLPQSSKPEESIVQAQQDKKNIPDLVKFNHRAMNANFEVFIQDARGSYAGRAARAAFNEVDRLEGVLSRYIENSDVSRINSLSPGQHTMVDEDTLRCLQIAQRAGQLTDGAFDVTIGNLIMAWKNDDAQRAQSLLADRPTMKMLQLNADDFTVTVTAQGVVLDLGGIGKGYAVDVIAETLDEWGIEKALIHAGASSIRALNSPSGKNGWPVTLTNPIDQTTMTRLELQDEVFSCSGLQGGQHIINPLTGQAVSDRRACWIRMKENAALADALSTAGMMMPIQDLHSLQDALPGLSVMLLKTSRGDSPELIKAGQWPEE